MRFTIASSSLASAFAIAMAFGAAGAAHAETVEDGGTTLSIDGELRVLGEAIGGQFRSSSTDSEFLLTSRVKINAEADFGPIAIGGELRDSRALSIETGSAARGSSINTLEPFQGWIALDFSPAGGEARLKGGRFTQKIGSGRLIGTPGYSNNIVTYAGAQLLWKTGGTTFTGFWARPFDTLPSSTAEVQDNRIEVDAVSDTKTVFGGHVAQKKLVAGATGEVYVYRFAEHDTPDEATKDRKLTTIGARLSRKPASGAFDFDVEAAGQFGSIHGSSSPADTTDIDVGAAFAHLEAGWTFEGPMKPRLSFEFDYATGEDGDAAHYSQFDMMYGARRGVFGPTGIYGPLSWNNLVSPTVRFEMEPSDGLEVFAAVRGAWLDSATASFAKTGVRDATGNSGRHAGTQIEGAVSHSFADGRLKAEVGGALFLNGRFMEDAPNASGNGDTHYGYVMLIAKF